MRRTAAALAFLGGLGLLLSGCAGDDFVEGAIVVTTEMEFSPGDLEVAAGEQTFVVQNEGDLRHTFSINSIGEEVTVNPGETKSLVVQLEPGEYTYVCRILDHEGLGMHGVLNVGSN